MANTFKFGNGEWAVGKETALAYNDENNNFKPLPFTFDRASTATVVNKDGLIETVGVDEPRIDFLNNTKGHLLLEPQRQNIITYSEDFTTRGGIWQTFGNLTKTLFASTSPDGYDTAAHITGLNGDGTNDFRYAFSYNPANKTLTYSVYLKGSGTLRLQMSNGVDQAYNEDITLTSDWKRHSVSGTFNSTSVSTFYLVIDDYINKTATEYYVWGAQLEVGSYATSYIPTSGQSGGVTRSAETTSQTVPDGVIGQTEGTIFIDFKPQTLDATSRYLSVENSSSTSNGWMGVFAALISGDIRFRFYGDGWDFKSTLIIEKNTRYKIAFSYKDGVQTSAYINGNLIGNLTASLSGKSFQKIKLSEAAFGVRGDADFKDIKLYDTIKTNTELQALTTI